MYLLESWNALSDGELVEAVDNPETEIFRHAVKIMEARLKSSAALAERIIPLAIAGDLTVRFQLALALGDVDSDVATGSLQFLGRRDAADAWMRAAIVSSCIDRAGEIACLLLDPVDGVDGAQSGRELIVGQLATVVGSRGNQSEIKDLLMRVGNGVKEPGLAFAALSGLGQGLTRRRERLSDWVARIDDSTRVELDRIVGSFVAAATSESSQVWPTPAIDFLAHLSWSEAKQPLSLCLASSHRPDVQRAALRSLAAFNELTVATLLLQRWKQLTPPLRDEAVSVLLSRPIWYEPLISALESGEILISQVSIPQRTRLAAIRDEKLAERAKIILAAFVLGTRKETIDRYQESLKLNGDAARGQIVYRRECLNCHKLRGEGHDVGPSLETVQHRSPQEILIHVLDPNREVSPNFLDYTVRLTDGRVLTGLIAAETDSGLTLRRAQNQEDAILRSEIDDITSSGKSLMPEGVEQKITLQEMSDLIAYLRQGT